VSEAGRGYRAGRWCEWEEWDVCATGQENNTPDKAKGAQARERKQKRQNARRKERAAVTLTRRKMESNRKHDVGNETTYVRTSRTVSCTCMTSSWGTNPTSCRIDLSFASFPLMRTLPCAANDDSRVVSVCGGGGGYAANDDACVRRWGSLTWMSP
jgi:hypothetical protein